MLNDPVERLIVLVLAYHYAVAGRQQDALAPALAVLEHGGKRADKVLFVDFTVTVFIDRVELVNQDIL